MLQAHLDAISNRISQEQVKKASKSKRRSKKGKGIDYVATARKEVASESTSSQRIIQVMQSAAASKGKKLSRGSFKKAVQLQSKLPKTKKITLTRADS